MEILVQPFDYDVMPCECDEGGGSGGSFWFPGSDIGPVCPGDCSGDFW